MKKNKKLISILVACIMFCTTSITCIAATTCPANHKYREIITEYCGYVCDKYKCGKKWEMHEYCKTCDELLDHYYEIESGDHSFELRQATCDGINQTWYYRCTKGGYTITENKPCPIGPHSGSCTALPLGNITNNPELS